MWKSLQFTNQSTQGYIVACYKTVIWLIAWCCLQSQLILVSASQQLYYKLKYRYVYDLLCYSFHHLATTFISHIKCNFSAYVYYSVILWKKTWKLDIIWRSYVQHLAYIVKQKTLNIRKKFKTFFPSISCQSSNKVDSFSTLYLFVSTVVCTVWMLVSTGSSNTNIIINVPNVLWDDED